MKQIKMLAKSATLVVTSLMLLSSCKKDNNDNTVVTADVLVSCEGPFGSGTGTISKISLDSNAVQNNAFETANGFPLGNIVQSVSVFNDRAYIVVNNAHKVEVATASTLTSVGRITGLVYPRSFLGISEQKGYITMWGSTGGKVMVIDLTTLQVTDSIPCGYGSESMIKKGKFVYVTNAGDFINSDNTVTVIDSETDEVETTITVGKNSTGIVQDNDGKLWVLCNGTFGSLDGSLVRISTTSNTADLTIPINLDSYQARLTINKAKNKLFFSVGDKTFAHSISSTTFDNNAFIPRGFYAVAIDPNSDILYCADAKDFISDGTVIRYDLTTTVAIDSFQTGLIPGNFFFN